MPDAPRAATSWVGTHGARWTNASLFVARSFRARTPLGQDEREIRCVDDTIAVRVGARILYAIGVPSREDRGKIVAVNDAGKVLLSNRHKVAIEDWRATQRYRG